MCFSWSNQCKCEEGVMMPYDGVESQAHWEHIGQP